MEDDEEEEEYLGMASMFEPDEEEQMSQELSQVSLDDSQGYCSSPVSKKKRLTCSPGSTVVMLKERLNQVVRKGFKTPSHGKCP